MTSFLTETNTALLV